MAGLSTRRSVVAGVVIAVLIGVAGALWRWNSPWESRATYDTYQYARVAYSIAGRPPMVARRDAAKLRCALWSASRPAPPGVVASLPLPRPLVAFDCAGRARMDRPNRRYDAIFGARPAYPALVAVLIPILGRSAFSAMTVVLAVLVGLSFVIAARASGHSWLQALVGEVAVFALPTGLWATRVAPEGGVYAALLVATAGACWQLRAVAPRTTPLAILLAGIVAAFAFKSADAVAYAIVTAVVAGLGAIAFRARRRTLAVVSGTATAAASGLVAVSTALGWPGLATTLQDTFTDHFRNPLVRHPWHRLWAADWDLIRRLGMYGWSLTGVVLLAASLYVLVRARGAASPAWIALMLVGPVVVAVHPVTSEIPRLMAPVWLVAAAGIGVLAPMTIDAPRWAARAIRQWRPVGSVSE